jgi:HK97 gp10 family phage protein
VSDQTIVGGKELDAFLQSLPLKIERNIMRAALSAGARVILREAKDRAPVGPTSSENAKLYGGYEGALRDSIRLSSRVGKDGRITASVKVGGMTKKGADVYYAHMVEFGTRPHIIKAAKGEALKVGSSFPRVVHHPGAAHQPFMRPAFDYASGAAITAVTDKIRSRLTKEGINAPAPEVE